MSIIFSYLTLSTIVHDNGLGIYGGYGHLDILVININLPTFIICKIEKLFIA